MSHSITAAKDRVPVGQKAAFGAGHFILNILPTKVSLDTFYCQFNNPIIGL